MNSDYERSLVPRSVSVYCGIDEAGRGPLAGPVFAAAVVLPREYSLPLLDDSKKLSEKKREILFDQIKEIALSLAVAQASAAEIDRMNILKASLLAMKRAADALGVKPELLFIDGNRAEGFDIPAIPVVKGDSLLPSIAAASVLAKVSRDRYCLEMHEKYPEYEFAVHKGYPTKRHFELLEKFGPCPEHRLSFGPVKKALESAR